MKLELSKVTLEPEDLNHLWNLLGEAYRADGNGLPPQLGEPQPSRAVREGQTWKHYETLAAEMRTAAEKIAQTAFERGVAYSANAKVTDGAKRN